MEWLVFLAVAGILTVGVVADRVPAMRPLIAGVVALVLAAAIGGGFGAVLGSGTGVLPGIVTALAIATPLVIAALIAVEVEMRRHRYIARMEQISRDRAEPVRPPGVTAEHHPRSQPGRSDGSSSAQAA
jgi:hypothetical protein